MLEELTLLYQSLKAYDMSLLVHAEEHNYDRFTDDLKLRARCIAEIQDLLRELTPDTSPKDLALIKSFHSEAILRDKRIITIMKNLRDKSKEEYRRCMPVASPYLKNSSRTRVSA